MKASPSSSARALLTSCEMNDVARTVTPSPKLRISSLGLLSSAPPALWVSTTAGPTFPAAMYAAVPGSIASQLPTTYGFSPYTRVV